MTPYRQPYPGHCPACNGKSLYRRLKSALIFCNLCGASGFNEADIALYESQQRGIKRHKHAGLTAWIRRLLRAGPLSVQQLALRTGATKNAVVSSLRQTMATGGGIIRAGDRKNETYQFYAPKREPIAGDDAELIRKAQTITVGRGSRWGAGLV